MLPPPPAPASNIETQELSEHQVDSLLARLVSLLPYSIPLTRRLQHHKKQPSATAHVLLLTSSSLLLNGISKSHEAHDSSSAPLPSSSDGVWLAAYVDLAIPGQTQSWLFASWELPSCQPEAVVEKDLVYALVHYLYHHMVPSQPTEPSADWLWLRDNGKNLSQPYSRNKTLFGAVHERVYAYFPQPAITRIDPSYGKYIFKLPLPLTLPVNTLPKGYLLGDMTEDLLLTVLDKSPIPRSARTLKLMQNVGLYHESRPVAWGFLGLDGSISSVHTEPEYRGCGFAGIIVQELIRRQASKLEEGDQERGAVLYAHADVSNTNGASNSVMKKLHGQVMWGVAWVEVDLREALSIEAVKAQATGQ